MIVYSTKWVYNVEINLPINVLQFLGNNISKVIRIGYSKKARKEI
jgi:hypothetical protein